MIRRIGGGSYGEVWLARSVTGALRAVKVVWRSRFASERPYEREFNGIVQFEPISRSHPGVVNVLHVRRDGDAGCFIYVMELADDATPQPAGAEAVHRQMESYVPRTLASELKSRGRLVVADAVALGVQLAGALGHLHRHGLVHRDVKPSNVIFVHGQAKLADIGLVTTINEERSFVGTEGFIPPEGPGTERADLFALGRLLYEAVTGKNRCDFPGLPDDLDRWPRSEREALIELNEVLARACAPEAKKRHSNAAELAGDLNLILAGRSVRRAYRVERRLRRATWVLVAALAVVCATVFSNWLQRRQREFSEAQAKRETTLREATQKSLARAEAAERESQKQLYTALLEQARATVLSGELGHRIHALAALRRAAAISNSAGLRREVLAALALPDLRFEREVVFAPGGAPPEYDPALARVATGPLRGPVEIRAVTDHRLLAALPASTNLPAYVRQWSLDGRFLAVKRDYPDGGVTADWEVWDVAAERRVLLLRGMVRDTFCFHPRLPRVMATHRSNGTAIWNLEDGRELARLPQANRAHLLRFSPEGERVAAVTPRPPGMIVAVHDVANPDTPEIAVSPVISAYIVSLAWHPDGRWLAVPDQGNAVQWMDAQTGETGLLGRHKSSAVSAVFSPDGDWLFTGGWERELICWNARTRRRAFGLSLDSVVMQISADGRRCVVLNQTTAKFHAFERPAAHRELAEDLGGLLRQAVFSADGRWLAASGGQRAGVWELASGGPGALADEGSNTRLFFTPDAGELFATRRPEGTPAAFRWRITPAASAAAPPALTKLPLRRPRGFTSLAVSSNLVVMTTTNGTQLLAPDELETGAARWTPTLAGLNGGSPNGRWLGIYRSFGTTLQVHRLPGLERVASLPHPASIGDFQFSPLGDEVAIGSQRSPAQIALWNTATWERTRTLTNFGRLLYTPDARALWLTKDQRTSGLHDARTLEPLLLLPTGMLPLALSPDGRHLAVSLDAQRLQVWDLAEVRRQLDELGLDWGGGGNQ